jgi:hypothetical protein
MDLAKLQNQINNSKNTEEALSVVDAFDLSMGTVLIHKRSGAEIEIRYVTHHFIEGLQYIGVCEDGIQWFVNAHSLTKKWNIKK